MSKGQQPARLGIKHKQDSVQAAQCSAVKVLQQFTACRGSCEKRRELRLVCRVAQRTLEQSLDGAGNLLAQNDPTSC